MAEPTNGMTSQHTKLPAEINTATRSLHTHLNALITSRLPLALPPHSSTPDVYLTGIIPFASIYIAFENAWDHVCARHISPSSTLRGDELWVNVPLDTSGDSPSSQDTTTTQLLGASQLAPPPELAVSTLLQSLRPHGLARSNRLRRDIATLLGISFDDVDAFLNEHASDATTLFIKHIDEIVAGKPHVLLAYAFVLYMAIFSGGRWIRSVLASKGSGFWATDDEPTSPPASPRLAALFSTSSVHERLRTFTREQQERFEDVGLSFWFWSGMQDGVDIKAEFKQRLDGAEELLTEAMRTDVIAEAREIFVRCEGLVGELDETVGRQGLLVNGIKSKERQAALDEPRRIESSTILRRRQDTDWLAAPGFAGLALVLSCVSWYAMYHAGIWNLM